jgi:hypothetical protein
MKPLTSLVAGLLALVLLLPARAQLAGSIDPSFATAVASVSGGRVNAVLVEPDGQILIAGSFNPGSGTAGLFGSPTRVFAVALQPVDGKILVGGLFFSVNGLSRSSLARLNTDGSVDAFNPVANDQVLSIAVQGDG